MEMKIKTAVAYGQSKEVGIYALASVVNALAAEGVTDPMVQLRIMIPEYAYKSRMHTMEKVMKKLCQDHEIALLDITSERSNVITQSMVLATGTGCQEQENKEKKVQAGCEIVLTKWIGLEGMLRILGEKEAELRERFSPGFLKQIASYKPYVFAQKEISIAAKNGAKLIRQVGEGGIFAALHHLAKETELGLDVDLKKIPILQETVEVCEHFRLNPYQLTSAGTMIIVTDDGEKLVEKLKEQGVESTLIGKFADNNDKILRNGEEIRYIDRPAPDEIMKIFETQLDKDF